MTTIAPSAKEGLFHEASIYASDAELAETALPFLTDGLKANEPTYVILGAHGEGLVRDGLGEPDGLHYVPAADAYVNPALTVQSYRDVLTGEVAAGAEQIRFITEVPHPGTGSAWDWWGRYEVAVNEIFADLPVWAICTYDERSTPRPVLDEVLRAHPFVARPRGEHASNAGYESPERFLSRRSSSYVDPLESSEPLFALTDPSLAEARGAAEVTAGPLGAEASENLALAVSELVANAQLYGSPPVTLRLWAGSDRVLVAVEDHGAGIHDPTVGLAPVDWQQRGGRGLWIADQLCDHLSIVSSGDGCVIRLVVGSPHVAG